MTAGRRLSQAAWPDGGKAAGSSGEASGARELTMKGIVSETLPTVLIVDDHPLNITLLEAYLEQVDCEVAVARGGTEALEILSRISCDLVLLDIQMDDLDGFTVCQRMKSDPRTRLVPVVMVTALSATDDRIRALDVGADDFLAKPVDRLELIARVTSLLRLKRTLDQLEDTERVVFALARAVEAKDSYTESHTSRVASSARALGECLGLDEAQLDDLYRGGAIHDIGKIGIPDRILLKSGPLTPGEMEIMRSHPILGEEIARPLRTAAGLLSIIRHHHEAVDGTGYPDGLSGDDIPLAARIVSICDAYDALISDRPYRSGMSEADAIAVLNEGAGKQWDSRLVDLFIGEMLGHRLGQRPKPSMSQVS
jgi:putative two-component system response regulator